MIKAIYKQLIPEKQRIRNRLFINKVSSVFYRGNTFTCNVCGKSFRRFKPKGTWVIRENAKCPFCESLERTRLMLFYLQEHTHLFTQTSSLLHFAPESGLKSIFRKIKTLTYINGDFNAANADEQIDVMNIPYPDETFEYVICSHVLGYASDELKAVQEIRRVLQPDGVALILTLIDWNNPETYESETVTTPEERLKHYSDPGLLRLHGADFADRLRAGGFQVEVIDYIAEFDEETQQRYSLGSGDRETIFRCTKKRE